MILIAEFMDGAAVERLAASHPTKYRPDLPDHEDELRSAVGDVKALVIRNRVRITSDLLDAAPRLECIGRLGVGLDNIDLGACQARGIAVYPATGANSLAVAEYVISTAAMLLRGAYFAREEMLAGQWPRQRCAGREIAGKNLGLVGLGGIALETARLALGLGMGAAAHDPFVPADDTAWEGIANVGMAELLARSDVVSLHVPLTDVTRQMISSTELAAMKPDAILINTARGGIVDETALCTALKSGGLSGAALDVFEDEPLTVEAAAKFRDTPRLVLTPHIAGVTVESNFRVSVVTADAVIRHLSGSVL